MYQLTSQKLVEQNWKCKHVGNHHKIKEKRCVTMHSMGGGGRGGGRFAASRESEKGRREDV